MTGSTIHVRCYSGHRYAQEPREVNWSGQWRRVVAVRRRWFSPGQSGFEVILAGGTRLEVVYVESADEWLGRPVQGRPGAAPPVEPPAASDRTD
jgi:hypothetical protein